MTSFDRLVDELDFNSASILMFSWGLLVIAGLFPLIEDYLQREPTLSWQRVGNIVEHPEETMCRVAVSRC